MNLKLYLLSQNDNTGPQTYESAVVAAPSEEVARTIHPTGRVATGGRWESNYSWAYHTGLVDVRYLGEAEPEMRMSVICHSFRDWL